MDYLEQIKSSENYGDILKKYGKYLTATAKKDVFPTGNRPDRTGVEKLLAEAGIPVKEMSDKSIDYLILQITEDVIMKRT